MNLLVTIARRDMRFVPHLLSAAVFAAFVLGGLAHATVPETPDPYDEPPPDVCEAPLPNAMFARATTDAQDNEASTTYSDRRRHYGRHLTTDPIDAHDGAVTEASVDIDAPGLSAGWEHKTTYNSMLTGITAYGGGWMGGELDTYLKENGDDIDFVISAASKRTFTGPNLDPPADSQLTMEHKTADQEYLVTDQESGDVWRFHDFTVSNDNHHGKLIERTTVEWMDASPPIEGTTYLYDSYGYVIWIFGPEGEDWKVHCGYDYYSPGTLEYIEFRAWTGSSHLIVKKAEYTYKNSSHHSDTGSDGALIQVKIRERAKQVLGWMDNEVWNERYVQYRYYSDGKLKGVFEPEAVERSFVNHINGGHTEWTSPDDILTQSDWTYTKQMASRWFTYYSSNADTSSIDTAFESSEDLHARYGGANATNVDETGMAEVEKVRGDAGVCCGDRDGAQTQYFFYVDVANPNSTEEINEVTRLVIEDTVDGDRNPVYRTVKGLNSSGRLLREAVIENPISGPRYWCKSWVLNDDNTVAEHRLPSAHNVASDTDLRKFLHPYLPGGDWSNDIATLRPSDGVITVYEYDAESLQTGVRVKKGSNGSAYYVSATDHYGGTDPTRQTLVTATYEYPTKTTSRASGVKTQRTYAFWTNGQIKSVKTTLPAVGTAQNGSGVSTEMWQYYDEDGRLRWTKDGEGHITYQSYHPLTGGMAYTVRDADPNSLPASASSNPDKWLSPSDGAAGSNKPTRDGGLPTALQLVEMREFDDLGRETKHTDASGAEHVTEYHVNRTVRYPYWTGSSSSLHPVVAVMSNAGVVTDTYEQAGYALEEYSRRKNWHRMWYNVDNGQLRYSDRYHSPYGVNEWDPGSVITNFNRTVYLYDHRGRRDTDIRIFDDGRDDGEQVTKTTFDTFGRPVEVRRGVSDLDHDMTSDYSVLPTMARISLTEYDHGGVGDGHVTRQVGFYDTGTTDNSGVMYHRTFRGQLRGTEPFHTYDPTAGTDTKVGPFTVQDIDWSGRTTASAVYATNPSWSTVLGTDGYSAFAAGTSSGRRSLSKSYYDNLGRTYRTEQVTIDPATGNADGSRVVDQFYDRNGQVVAIAPRHGVATENAFDGVGRQFQSRTVRELEATKYSGGKFQYRSPTPKTDLSSMSGGNDTVLTMSHQVFDASGNVTETHLLEQNHNDTDGISLSSNDYVRSTTYSWYDGADRLSTRAVYGSGDTTAGAGSWKYTAIPTRSAAAPTSSSDTKLVTRYEYDQSWGTDYRYDTVTHPTGMETQIVRDWMGRKARLIQDADGDTEQSTYFDYDGLDNVWRICVGNISATGSQPTLYRREDPYNASLATEIWYADWQNVEQSYFLDGKLKSTTDDRGRRIDYTYKSVGGGRVLEWEKVTTLGTGVDNHIRSINREYDDVGRLLRVTSHADTGGGAIRNQIQFEYDKSGGVKRSYQSHEGAVSTGGGSPTPSVQYIRDYSTDGSGYHDDGPRVSQIVYPSGKSVFPQFGAAGSLDDRLHRTYQLQGNFTGSTLTLSQYKYNGPSRLVETLYSQNSVHSRMDLADGDGTYEHLDRFGRVKTKDWRLSSTIKDQFNYTHDYAGNRLTRDIPSSVYSTNDLDHTYAYDDRHRLTNFDEGSLSGGSIASPKAEQDWTLSDYDNWDGLVEKTNGSTTLNQARTHNRRNELTEIDSSTTHVAYDDTGNMIKLPKPGNWSSHYDLVYDAWNRLMEVKDGAVTVVRYEYDALNRRIVKTAGSDTYHYYYNTAWQMLEVRKDGVSNPVEQYVWHPYYIDALAVRYRDANTDGDYNDSGEVHFPTHDANLNVTALLDSSGSVIERYTYSPYGQLAVRDPSFAIDADGKSDFANPYTYTGRRFDEETGLYQYRNRYYDPQLGRFVTRDPIGYAGSKWNLYEYVGSRPTFGTDHLGLEDPQLYVHDYDVTKPAPPFPRPWVDNAEPLLGFNLGNLTSAYAWPTQYDELLRPIQRPVVEISEFSAPLGPSAGRNTHYALPPAGGAPVGAAGCRGCWAVVIKCPNGAGVYHFTDTDDPQKTLRRYCWPRGCRALVCGGDTTAGSRRTGELVISALDRVGIPIDGVSSARGCGMTASGTWYITNQLRAGDANRDLRFDGQDFVQVILAGKYGTGQPATWEQGDWNGDGVFDQLDLAIALRSNLYNTGPYRE